MRSPCPFEHWNGAPLKCNPQHGNQVGERLLPRVARSPPTTYPYPAVSRPSVQYSTVAARPPKASGRGRRLTPSAGRPEHCDVKFHHWRTHHNHTPSVTINMSGAEAAGFSGALRGAPRRAALLPGPRRHFSPRFSRPDFAGKRKGGMRTLGPSASLCI